MSVVKDARRMQFALKSVCSNWNVSTSTCLVVWWWLNHYCLPVNSNELNWFLKDTFTCYDSLSCKIQQNLEFLKVIPQNRIRIVKDTLLGCILIIIKPYLHIRADREDFEAQSVWMIKSWKIPGNECFVSRSNAMPLCCDSIRYNQSKWIRWKQPLSKASIMYCIIL